MPRTTGYSKFRRPHAPQRPYLWLVIFLQSWPIIACFSVAAGLVDAPIPNPQNVIGSSQQSLLRLESSLLYCSLWIRQHNELRINDMYPTPLHKVTHVHCVGVRG